MRGLRPEFSEWGEREVTPRRIVFEVRNLWRLERSDTPAIEERLRYTVHAADGIGRVIDIEATFLNLTAEPIVLQGQTGRGYGGLNVRIDGNRPDVQFATANGRLERDTDVIEPASPWAARSSRPAEGKTPSGVAVFQHPKNPDFPARSWALRHYGFLGAAWPGESKHAIEPGDSLELRYRLFVFRGTPRQAGVEARFQQFLAEHEPDD